MKKDWAEQAILSMEVPSGGERVESFNADNCVTDKTKLIIVGTITPSDGTKRGYFYTAPRNRIYGYIDEALGTHLKEKKDKLGESSSDKKASIVDDIKEELIAHQVAFLDVMKYVVRSKNSSADKEISAYCLDCGAFDCVPTSAMVICNSKLAEKCYTKIREKVCKEVKYQYLSQRCDKKEKWIKAIREALEL